MSLSWGRRTAGPGLLLLLAFVPFAAALLGDGVLTYRDHLAFFVPKRWLLTLVLSGDVSPFWNPYQSGGVPLLGDPQSGLLYPPTAFLFWLLPFRLAYNLLPPLHLALAGCGMYALLRQQGLRPASSLFGGLVLQWSGFAFSLTELTNNLFSWAWLPIALVLAGRAARAQSHTTAVWRASCAGIALSLCFLGGEPLIAAFAAALCVLYCAGLRIRPEDGASTLGRAAARVTVMGVVAWGCSAFVAIPFLFWVHDSLRGAGISLEVAAARSLQPVDFLAFLAPLPFETSGGLHWSRSQDWLTSLYAGWLPLSMLFWLPARRLRSLLPWLLAGLLGLMLATGHNLPGYGWLHSHAGLSAVRYPVRFLFLTFLVFALLSACGMQALLDRVRKPGASVGFRSVLPVLVAAGIGCMFLSAPFDWPVDAARGVSSGCLRGAVLIACAGAVILLRSRNKVSQVALCAALIALAAADLGLYARPGFETAPLTELQERPPALDSLRAPFESPPRVLCSAPLVAREAASHAGTPPTGNVVRGAMAFLPPVGSVLLGAAELTRDPVLPLAAYEPFHEALLADDSRGLAMFLGAQLRVELVRTTGGKSVRYRRIVADPTPLRLLDARAPLEDPSAQGVYRFLRSLGNEEPTALPVPEDVVGLHGLEPGRSCARNGLVIVDRLTADYVHADVDVPCTALAVMTTNLLNDGGWRARLDGEPAELFPVLGAFPGIVVPPGRHELEFRYRPVGIWIAASASLGLGLLVILASLTLRVCLRAARIRETY